MEHPHNEKRFWIRLVYDVKDIVEPLLSRNAYFAHHESILLAMVNDEETNIRRLGWRRIYKARQDAASTKRVRAFAARKLISRPRLKLAWLIGSVVIPSPP